jgi:hypothetical protein
MTMLASFARVYVSDIDEGIAIFQRSPQEQPRLRFSHSSGLELALVGDVLILAGPAHLLDAFRATQVTVIVDDLDTALQRARSQNGSVLRGPATQPTGRNATVRYRSGAIVEYVEWSPATMAQAEARRVPKGGQSSSSD